MKRKVPSKAAVACILTVAMLASATPPAQPAHAGGGVVLRPPFDGTYRVTAYFDHENPNYGDNNYIWIYNGERRPANSQNDNPPRTGNPYPYDGHDGWDWSMITGTNVLAAAAGNVVVAEWGNWGGGYGRTIVISHGNNYYTLYSHLDQLLVGVGDPVTTGQHIAESGATPPGTPAHLHFGVRHGGYANTNYAIDPFGWRGAGRDPLFNHNGKVSTCLWRSRDEDPISCADTIVEDAGQGSTISGAWNVSTMGNGYHMYYRYTTSDHNIYATWTSTATIRGPYKVYAYIPSQNATTHNATYWIYTVDGWRDFHIDQWEHSDEWILMGTYTLPANYAHVWMYADTGESPARWIAADAVKFRQYRANLPLVLRNYPPCSPGYGQLIVNGNFSTGDATGWTVSRSNCPISIVQPYGSDYGAAMGYCNLNQDTMYQFVCPAAPLDYATLSFRWWLTSNDTPYVDVDFLYVRVRDANGNLLQTLKTITNRSPKGQWYYEYFDLRAYAGQTIRISFEASNDGSYPSYFWIDDVSFAAYD